VVDEQVSLRDYVDSRFTSVEQATRVAMDANNYRLEEMNQFRKQLESERSTYVTRNEIDLMNKDKRADIALLLAIAGFIVGLAGLLLRL